MFRGYLKQSTQVTKTVLMVDSADHVTGKTGLAAGITKYLTKAGGTPAAETMTTAELDATNVKGVYSLVFTTTQTNTLGEYHLHLTAAGADPTDDWWEVVTYLPGEAATLQADQAVNVTKVGGTAQTARDLGAQLDAAVSSRMATFTLPTNFSALAITAGGLVDITQAAADKVWSSATRTLTAFSTALALSVWDVLETAIATASSIGLKVKTNLDAAISSRLATAGYTAPPTVAAIADGVWDEPIAGHLGAGSTGLALNSAGAAGDPWSTALPGAYGAGTAGKIVGDNLDAAVSSRSTYAGADTAGTTTLLGRIASALTITGGKVDVNDKTGFALSAAGVQAIWDALTAALTTVGSIGKRIADFLTGDAFVRLGAPAGASVSADVAAVKAETAAIKAKTDALPPDPADESLVIAATDAIYSRLGAPAGVSMAADVAAVKSDSGAIKAKTDSLTFTGAGRVDANLAAINNATGGAAALDRSARTMVLGTVDAAATTTSIPTSSLVPAAVKADQFKGRIVIFDKDTTTAALRGQATDITASSLAGVLTVSALTDAPVAGDTFVIV